MILKKSRVNWTDCRLITGSIKWVVYPTSASHSDSVNRYYPATDKANRIMKRIRIFMTGIVQGVGFRPSVYRLASTLDLDGFVRNRSDGLEIEVEGSSDSVDGFVSSLTDVYPPASKVDGISMEDVPPTGEHGFSILSTNQKAGGRTLCPADLATCEDCVRELFDPADRRYRYPFINCTNCGPRYTVVTGMPYDRPHTSMACFPMCPPCAAEYGDPLNRRFHAQPDACSVCGPGVWITDSRGKRIESDDPIREATMSLRSGNIWAIKGIGGFHIAADATDDKAVMALRKMKDREHKPFAVMAGDVVWAQRCVKLTTKAEEYLTSPARPIVLCPRKANTCISESVAPGIDTIGIMLPYTPLHHMLFRLPESEQTLPPLVMTSGNPSDMPISVGNREALGHLGHIADFFLLHNRDIVTPADDSVIQASGTHQVFVRRSRGYVPDPIRLPHTYPPALGTGPYLKSTPCILEGSDAFLGQHVGDLETLENIQFHQKIIARLIELTGIRPAVVGCDLNPDFPSSRWAAEESGLPYYPVQHHYAHVVAGAIAEHVSFPVLGLVLDGTGYGTDGTIWGCELLSVDGLAWSRIGHQIQFPLPGGDAGVRNPWRNAIGIIHSLFGESSREIVTRFFGDISSNEKFRVLESVRRGVNAPLHSSCGRLFDAVSAITGLCLRATYEAHAPMVLESRANTFRQAGDARCSIPDAEVHEIQGSIIFDTRPLLRGIVEASLHGVHEATVSYCFHEALTRGLSTFIRHGVEMTGIDTVILSGGCLLNQRLRNGLMDRLQDIGIRAVLPTGIPVGDGCVGLGQAVVAAWHIS